MSRVGTTLSCAILALALGAAEAGDLSPAPGPIAPTMKSLDAIEPRVCVNDLPGDADAAHVISVPGSYYLCADILAPDQASGIRVDAGSSGVFRIDLEGFSIEGAPESHTGILCVGEPGGIAELEVVGGRVRLFGQEGMRVEHLRRASVRGMDVSDTGGSGIVAKSVVKFKAGAALAKKVNIAAPGGNGLDAEDCGAVEISGLSVSGAGGHGVSVRSPARVCERCEITDTDSSNNGGRGVDINDVPEVFASRVSTRENAAEGFGVPYFPGVDDFADLLFRECSAIGNGGNGFECVIQPGQPQYGNITFERCRASGNHEGWNVLHADGSVTFSSCSSEGNDSHGIHVSMDASSSSCVRITGCSASHNGRAGVTGHGIFVESPAPGSGGSLCIEIADSSTGTNLSAGYMQKARHDAMMATVQNMRCYANGGNGAEIEGGSIDIDECSFLGNGGSGLSCSTDNPLYVADSKSGQNVLYGMVSGGSGGPGAGCGSSSHFLRCSADGNGLDGLSVVCAAGGEITECSAHGNTGAGIRVGDAPTLTATGLRLDRCYATNNDEGIVVDDAQNVVLRCTAAHNTTDNLRVHAESLSGPDTDAGWSETKPYAWP